MEQTWDTIHKASPYHKMWCFPQGVSRLEASNAVHNWLW